MAEQPTPGTLAAALEAHPDVVYVAWWTREDVAQSILDEGRFEAGHDASDEDIAAVTPEQMHAAAAALADYVFPNYPTVSWSDAIADRIAEEC